MVGNIAAFNKSARVLARELEQGNRHCATSHLAGRPQAMGRRGDQPFKRKKLTRRPLNHALYPTHPGAPDLLLSRVCCTKFLPQDIILL